MFVEPKVVLEPLGLQGGESVAEFGAGSGAYVIPAAHAVLPGGVVYAIDLQRELFPFVKAKAHQEGLQNVFFISGDIAVVGGSKLADDSMDALVLSNTLFQIENKVDVVKEIFRVLQPRGRVLFIDWSDSFANLGPRDEDVIPYSQAQELFEKNGFVLGRSVPAGEYHYGIVFYKRG